MKTKFLLMFTLILYNVGAYSQDRDCACAYGINYEEINLTAGVIRPPDTLETEFWRENSDKISHKFMSKFIIYSCKGAASVKIFDENKNLLIEGTYSDAIELKEEDSQIEDIETGTIRKYRRKYYEPLRNGAWKYYDCPQYLKR